MKLLIFLVLIISVVVNNLIVEIPIGLKNQLNYKGIRGNI